MVWRCGLGVPNLNKLIIIRQSLKIRGLILEIFWLGLAVWYGLQNLNNVEHGDMTRQNFSVTDLILGIFWLGMVWQCVFICQTWTSCRLEIWLGRASWLEASLQEFFSLVLRFGLVSKIWTRWYGLTVWLGFQNLNKLVLGDMARQNLAELPG